MKSHQNLRNCTAALALGVLLPAASMADVEFSGLTERQLANVTMLSPLSTTACDSARWRVERLFRESDKKVKEALRALGFYQPVIEKSLRWDDNCWHASFKINPGEAVRYRDVEIDIRGEAGQDAIFMERIRDTRPQRGDVLDHGGYSSFKSLLDRTASNRGYFDADFDVSKIVVDIEKQSADLSLGFDAGAKYRFGELKFTDGILRESILRGYTDIRSGDEYSAKAINDLYEALNGSSYFSSVSIDTEPLDRSAKTVPVNVQLVAAKRRVFSVGAGFSTDLGPNGRIGYTHRRINDRGHQFESKIFGSAVKSELNASYRWPKRDPRQEWFSIVSGIQHEETDTSEQDSFKLGFLRSKSLGEDWLQTRYVDYAYEDFTVADQQSISQLIIIGTNWETAKGRVLSRASNGYRFSLDLRGASDSLGSDTSFLQLRTSAKWLTSFSEKTRFLARVSFGLTAQDALEELPASVRFFAGGDNSVRGYDFETLGPKNEDGEVIGGSHRLDVSVEIDRLFREKWAVAAFVDAGDAFDDTDLNLNIGAGFGVRWYSPVGPIRLDFAHPFDDPDDDFRVHISLGPDL